MTNQYAFPPKMYSNMPPVDFNASTGTQPAIRPTIRIGTVQNKSIKVRAGIFRSPLLMPNHPEISTKALTEPMQTDSTIHFARCSASEPYPAPTNHILPCSTRIINIRMILSNSIEEFRKVFIYIGRYAKIIVTI